MLELNDSNENNPNFSINSKAELFENNLNEKNDENKKEHNSIDDEIYFIRAQNIRIAFSVALLILAFLEANFGFLYSQYNIYCTIDVIQDFFLPMNQYFNNNYLTLWILILVSLVADLLLIIISIIWITRSNSYRFICSIICFSFLGIVSNYLLEIKPSINSVWEYPGVPSIVVNYTSTNYSLIYPIDVGILFICYYEYKRANCKALAYLCLSTSILLAFMRLVCQSAYSPGILMSYICADFIYELVDENISKVDFSGLGIKNRSF